MPLHENEIRLPRSGHTPSSGLFKLALEEGLIEKLGLVAKKRAFRQGEQVISAGARSTCVHILDHGSAEVLIPDDDGEVRSIREIAPGEMLGLTESLAGTAWVFSVRSMNDSVFLEIPRNEFVTFLRNEPNICFELSSLMAAAFIECFRAAADRPN